MRKVVVDRAHLVLLVFGRIFHVSCLSIPRIDSVSLVPITPTNFTTLLNATCYQCICLALANQSTALNCFLNNNTCQLFDRVPIRHRLQPGAQATLYFTSGWVPNGSQCCMPDLQALLAGLNNATKLFRSQSIPRGIALDNHGYLVNIQYDGNTIWRLVSLNLTLVDQLPLSESSVRNIASYENAYNVGTDFSSIEVVDSNTLTKLQVITHPDMNGVRDVIFLRDGQIMVVSSTNNRKLLFFNRSSIAPFNYSYVYQISTTYQSPHGLRYVNDSFFYATSWDDNSVYSHATMNGVTWTEALFVDVNTIVATQVIENDPLTIVSDALAKENAAA
jgi:hypothetical protein